LGCQIQRILFKKLLNKTIKYLYSLKFTKKYLRKFVIYITTFKFKKKLITSRFGNYKLILDLREYTAWSYYFKDYEKPIKNFVKKKLKKNSNAIDIGANLGYFSILFSSIIKQGKVYSFEPEKKNFKKLIHNIKLNNYSNILPYNIGLSNTKSQKKLFLTSEINEGGHHILNSNTTNRKYQIINTDKLDNIIKNKKIFKIVKIDVEGYELKVLKGMSNVLKRTHYIIIEENNNFRNINFFLKKFKFKKIAKFKIDLIFENQNFK